MGRENPRQRADQSPREAGVCKKAKDAKTGAPGRQDWKKKKNDMGSDTQLAAR